MTVLDERRPYARRIAEAMIDEAGPDALEGCRWCAERAGARGDLVTRASFLLYAEEVEKLLQERRLRLVS
jgi:hypothetical protein